MKIYTQTQALQARKELIRNGAVAIRDNASLRASVVQPLKGAYVSYYDEELIALVIVLKSKLRGLLK